MRNIALFLAAAGFGAATALAGTAAAQSPEDDTGVVCDRLNYRFQFDFKYRKSFPQADTARALHRSGVEKCESGDPAAGIADLREALRKIEVEPARL
ncbi:MAG: hypothetical protein CVT72_04250 [Alphaproteobacteria bacterium HGW-Alphaproteobacteria-11]|nr:MAG: hypothetical protein CVT72_04250 [Alphaproteobacteria bacterium HGW-Alphaproteobacteria-11]